MTRNCFICHSKLNSILITKWNITNIPDEQEIGFAPCGNCKLVIQTPTISPNSMFNYYESTATYINPGREGKPSQEKIHHVKRQLDLLSNTINLHYITSAFQIGCSDGYTLSKIKDLGVPYVSGVDPSNSSNIVARKLYDIETHIGVFEEFVSNQQFDLIVITHLLEHIYNPNEILQKCYAMLNNDGYILLEVPLFENHHKLPNGIFTLEHMNYFTEFSLKKLFSKFNFELLATEKTYHNIIYPVITMIFQKTKKSIEYNLDFEDEFIRYCNRDKNLWDSIKQKIKLSTIEFEKVYIWGAGIHTTQLLANTKIENFLTIEGVIDSSITKHNKKLGKYTIKNPEKDILENYTIIISSYASEREIYEYIKTNFNYKKIILLYEADEIK